MKADGTIRVAQEEAQKLAEEARAHREQARLNAEVVVPAQAAKEKAVVEAEAERQKRILIAGGEAGSGDAQDAGRGQGSASYS